MLGCHVAISLLKAGYRVVAIARSRQGVQAKSRVSRLLQAYPGAAADLDDLSILHVVEGDVMSPYCGLAAQDIELIYGELDAVVNCAGCVSFSPRCSEEVLKINVAGAANVAELTGRLKCRRLLHVSTAYVDTGLKGEGFRTPYEKSKLKGEKAVLDKAGGLGIDTLIIRPSIITGDQHHGFTPTFSGIYPFLRFLWLFGSELRKIDPADVIRWRSFLTGSVNIVPADYVADIIRAAAERPGKVDGTVNVINPASWKISGLMEILMPCFGARFDEEYILSQGLPDGGSPAGVHESLKLLMETYEPYFNVDLKLDTRATEALLKAAGMPILKNSQEWIHALVRWGASRNWEEIS